MVSTAMATTGGVALDMTEVETMAIELPRGVVLGAGERRLQSTSFRFSIAHFFLSSRHSLTSKRLVGTRPRTFLGLLTMGSETFSYALLNLASAGTTTRVQVLPLRIGLVMLAVVAGNVASYWPALLVGAFYCLAAFQAVLRVVNNDGGTAELQLSILDQRKAWAFADRINAAIAAR
jgi:hypothetical protein